MSQTPLPPQDPLRPFLEAAVAFINAPDWAAGRDIVRQQQALLFAPPAARAFDLLEQQYADQPDSLEMIQQHRAILQRCQEIGIEAAFDELIAAAELPSESIEAVMAFLNAPDWAESRQIVEAQAHLLLTDSADQVFAGLLAKYAGQPQEIADLERHRRLLQQARAEGIEAAFAPLLASAPSPEMVDAVLAFINAPTVEAKQQLLTQKTDLLLDSRTNQIFDSLGEKYADNPDYHSAIRNNQRLLEEARIRGVRPVMGELRANSSSRVTHDVMDAVRDYVAAEDWHAARQIVERHTERLLSDAAQTAFTLILQQVQAQPEVAAALRERQALLQRCREEGIAAAFSTLD